MRKKNFEIRTGINETVKTKGFVAPIKTPGNLRFSVSIFRGKWRTTELSTGYAVPGSFANNAEESVEQAQKAIDKVNASQTFLQGYVKGVVEMIEQSKEQRSFIEA